MPDQLMVLGKLLSGLVNVTVPLEGALPEGPTMV